MPYVIVGASIAGLSAAEAILERDPSARVVLLSEENRPPYCRPLLSYWLAGEAPESLFRLPTRILDRVDFRPGRKAVALDPAAKTLTLDDGKPLAYRRLLLATGAAPKKLGLAGEEARNVYDFRTLDDAEAIDRALTSGARRALVLGGGLVGVKAAHALAGRGVETLLCVTSPAPLSQALDEKAGLLAAEALRGEGVAVRTGLTPEALEGTGGALTGARFAGDAQATPCDLLIRAKGVAPRVELVERLGLETKGGLWVDDALQTPLPGVWAAGDAALAVDRVLGARRANAIWPEAAAQGRIAGLNMAGASEAHGGSWARNSVRVGALHILSAGDLRASGPGCETLELSLPGGGYRKFVTRDGVLVGFASVEAPRRGPSPCGVFVNAVGAGARLDALPLDPAWLKPVARPYSPVVPGMAFPE